MFIWLLSRGRSVSGAALLGEESCVEEDLPENLFKIQQRMTTLHDLIVPLTTEV